MPALSEPQFASRQVMVTEKKMADVSQPEDRHVARPARNLPFLMEGDFLQVINRDMRTWDFPWDRKHYTVEPGATTFVPFEALVDNLGDPRSMDGKVQTFSDADNNRGVVMDRHWELMRLYARYAVENDILDDLVAKAPKVEVRTLAGQLVTFPSQRPDMQPWPTPQVNPHAVNADTTKMIDSVVAENAELRSQIDRLESRMDDALAQREGVSTPEE